MTHHLFHFFDPSKNYDTDLLIADLFEVGFEGFEERENSLLGYIPSENVRIAADHLKEHYPDLDFQLEGIEDKDWNEEWEKNFSPIDVDGKILVRAPFHEGGSSFHIEIVIAPKRAFGTGHHATTYCMMKRMLEMDFKGKEVLDMGTGSGILAVLAEQRGAKHILAIDNDPWAFSNVQETLQLNHCKRVSNEKGEVERLKDKTFQVILANINRNVLLNDIPKYLDHLENKGRLLISGIKREDKKDILDLCTRSGAKLTYEEEKEGWLCLELIKQPK